MVERPLATRPWLKTAIMPAHIGEERLVPPTVSQGVEARMEGKPATSRLFVALWPDDAIRAVNAWGPKAPVPSKFLPSVHWLPLNCQSRTEPSL